MGMMSEFKEFAMRGNVIDLAVGVVIGAAFGKIVTALVDKVIMPPIGLLIGGVGGGGDVALDVLGRLQVLDLGHLALGIGHGSSSRRPMGHGGHRDPHSSR